MEETADGYSDRLHSAVVGDVVVIDKPVPLHSVCSEGWARIERRVTFFDGLISMFGRGVYKADSIVHCAQASAPASSSTPADPPAPPTSL
jgi:hypothetical protein